MAREEVRPVGHAPDRFAQQRGIDRKRAFVQKSSGRARIETRRRWRPRAPASWAGRISSVCIPGSKLRWTGGHLHVAIGPPRKAPPPCRACEAPISPQQRRQACAGAASGASGLGQAGRPAPAASVFAPPAGSWHHPQPHVPHIAPGGTPSPAPRWAKTAGAHRSPRTRDRKRGARRGSATDACDHANQQRHRRRA